MSLTREKFKFKLCGEVVWEVSRNARTSHDHYNNLE